MTASSHRRLCTRRLSRILGALLGCALLVGCGTTEDGLALPSQEQAREYQSAKFTEALQGLVSYFREATNIKGTVFSFGSFEGKKARSEMDTFVLGSPPAMLTKSRSGHEGDNIDTYHPAGSDKDLLLLGSMYRTLAPTPWVSHRTSFPATGYYICVMAGVMTGCKMLTAIELTQKENPNGLLRKYTKHPDGRVELLTGVTLKAFLEARVMIFPDVLREKMTDNMMTQMLPVRIKFAPDGSLDMFEINGVVEGGPSPLEVQVGYDITGTATAADFPPLPSGFDVTHLDEKARREFYDKLGDIKNKIA
ncbi:hypothetical protein GCM10027280_01800 [Micromonospora polyrhachis]|uniref:Lipoprotein n=1 Tax=Micromonospora polyrhachis TaxID=1282883 RepID=A0A7W7WNH3_9ACTN|nr:hypothetical protein [Micromonospora polyrhachis]MBB4957529.1 hypothetical protein [Micromonospora polyrhachis]